MRRSTFAGLVLGVVGVLLAALLLAALSSTGQRSSNSPGAPVHRDSSHREAAFVREAAPAPPPAAVGANQAPAAPPAGGIPVVPEDRKIAFTATLDVVVPDLDAAVTKLEDALAAAKGYAAKSEVKADPTSRRAATFTVRVPVEGFRKLLKELRALGVPERDQFDSEDKTEELVDVRARVKNLKAEEETLNKLLEKSANRDELFRARQEIRTIRGEIEQTEARLATLSKLTALSTIHLSLKEPVRHPSPEVPSSDPPASTPEFGQRAEVTFAESWALFKGFAQRVALVFVGATPWLPVIIPVGLIGFVAWRKTGRAGR